MNSTFWTITISGIILSIVFAIAQRKSKETEKDMDPNDFVVRMPKAVLILEIIVTVVFTFLFTVIIVVSGTLMAILYVSPFLLFGPFMIYLWHRWKIVIKDNDITVTKFFGKTKSYTFSDITNVKRGKSWTKNGDVEYIRAYHDKKMLFSLTDACPGFNIMISRLEEKGVPVE